MEVISAKNIVVDKDGLPVDQYLRRVTMRVAMTFRSVNCFTKDNFRKIMHKVDPKRFGDQSSPLLAAQQLQLAKALRESGIILEDKNEKSTYATYYFLNPRFAPKSASNHEDRIANFNASVRGIAERLVDNKNAQEKAIELITLLKLTRRLHPAKAGEIDVVVCPERIELDQNGVCISRAIVGASLPNGFKFFRVKGDAVTLEFDGRTPIVSVCMNKAVSLRRVDRMFEGTIMATFTGENVTIKGASETVGKHLRSVVRGALNGITQQKELFEEYIGVEIEDAKWRSVLASIRRGFRGGKNLRWLISQAMNKDVRRMAYRKNNFLGRDYNWFLDTTEENRKRRKQASDVFPALLQILTLKKITAVIDEGLPLIPALSELMGLPVPFIKKLAGLTRMKLRKNGVSTLNYCVLGETSIRTHLNKTPVDHVNFGHEEFDSLVDVGKKLGRYGYPFIGNYHALMAADTKNAEQVLRIIREPINATSEFIESLLVGYFDGHLLPNDHEFYDKHYRDVLSRIIAENVLGEQFSKKRAVKFDRLWHRHQNAILTEERAYIRRVRGVAPKIWPALTKNFSCKEGSLRFLTSDDELYAEGVEMSHCVGGYYNACLYGNTHIATIHAKDGSRSTVEFRVTSGDDDIKAKNGILYIAQHKSEGNDEPSVACMSIVNAYMVGASKKKYDFKPPYNPYGYHAEYDNENGEKKQAVEIPDELADEFLRLYDPVLPSSLSGKDIAWWKARVEEELAKDITFHGNDIHYSSDNIDHLEYYSDEVTHVVEDDDFIDDVDVDFSEFDTLDHDPLAAAA